MSDYRKPTSADGSSSDEISVPNISRRSSASSSLNGGSGRSRAAGSSVGEQGDRSRTASSGSGRSRASGSQAGRAQKARSSAAAGARTQRSASGRSRASMKRRRRRRRIQQMVLIAVIVVIVVLAAIFGYRAYRNSRIDRLTEEGLTLMREGDQAEAVDRFDEALKAVGSKLGKKGPAILEYKAEAQYDMGDYEGAIESLDRLLAVDPDNTEYRMNEVLCLLETGDYDRALELDVLQGRVYNKMALERMKSSDYEGAISLIQQGLLVDDGTAAADLSYNLAVACEYRGEYEQALSLFEDYENRFGSDENVEKEIAFLRSRVEEPSQTEEEAQEEPEP